MRRLKDVALVIGIASLGAAAPVLCAPVTVRPLGNALGPRALGGAAGSVAFGGWTPATGREPWWSDGTPARTFPLTDIMPGPESSEPADFTTAGHLTFFTATGPQPSGGTSRQLWVTDGTPAGTQLVRNIEATAMIARGSELFFAARDAGGFEVWRSDGTPAGTQPVTEIDNGHIDQLALGPQDDVYFAGATEPNFELWKTDEAGDATLLASIPASTSYGIESLHRCGDAMYFIATGQVWRSDGTAVGTQPVPGQYGINAPYSSLAVMSGIVYFGAQETSGSNRELWRTDGTAEGTKRVKPGVSVWSGGNQVMPQELVAFAGHVYFWGHDGVTTGLVQSDGTAAGTQTLVPGLVQDPTTPTIAAAESFLAFLPTNDQDVLWTTQGTPETTSLLMTGPQLAFAILTASGDRVFFRGAPTPPSYTLFVADRTARGGAARPSR